MLLTISDRVGGIVTETEHRVSVTEEDCPSPHSTKNKIGRVLWALTWWMLFRPSPRVFYGWRCFLLRLFGARIGRAVKIASSAKIWAPWNLVMEDESSLSQDTDCYCVAKIQIGSHATVSQYAFLCSASHDPSDPHMALTSAPISIGSQAWVCAGAFVAPGVTVDEGAVVGARAVVTKNVDAWTIVAGNPAQFIRKREIRESNA